jgi:hypothetical protein
MTDDSIPTKITDKLDTEVIDSFNFDNKVIAVTKSEIGVYKKPGLIADGSVETYNHRQAKLSRATTRFKNVLIFNNIDGKFRIEIPDKEEDVEQSIINARLSSEVDNLDIRFIYYTRDVKICLSTEKLILHIGDILWNDDYNAINRQDITDISVESNTYLNVYTDSNVEKIKLPENDIQSVYKKLTHAISTSGEESDTDRYNEVSDAGLPQILDELYEIQDRLKQNRQVLEKQQQMIEEVISNIETTDNPSE